MGISDTFALLRRLPHHRQVEFAAAALGEADAGVQLAATRLLIEAGGPRRFDLLVDRYSALLGPAREAAALHREELVRIARERVIAGGHPLRHAAFELLSDLGAAGSVDLLVLGLGDPSEPVRGVVLTGLLHNLRRALAAAPEGAPEGAPTPQAARDALRAVLRHFDAHGRTAFVDLLIGMGGAGLSIVNGVVMGGKEGGLLRAFVQALHEAGGAAVVDLLFRMAVNKAPGLHALAHEVFRLRSDAAFGLAVAQHVCAIPSDSPLAAAVREVPWPAAVLPIATRLAPAAALRLLDLLTESRREPVRCQQHVEAFLFHQDAGVVRRALAALLSLRCPAGFDAVERVLATAPEELRLAAANLVRELAPVNKVALLTPLLGNGSRNLRRLALREIAAGSFDRYLRCFDEMDQKARQVAARALAKMDDTLLERLNDEIVSLDPVRRVKALQIVEFLDAEAKLREPLMALLGDADKRVRATAVRIVQCTGSVEGMRMLLDALADDDRRVRANAIEAFAEIDDPGCVQLLLPFLRDRDNRVRANAGKALWRLGCAEARDCLIEMLDGGDDAMRLSAAWAIGDLRLPDARDLLLRRRLAEANEAVRGKIDEIVAGLAAAEAPA